MRFVTFGSTQRWGFPSISHATLNFCVCESKEENEKGEDNCEVLLEQKSAAPIYSHVLEDDHSLRANEASEIASRFAAKDLAQSVIGGNQRN